MPIAPDQAGSLLESLVSLARTTRIIAHRDAERSVSGTPIAVLQLLREDDPRLGDLAERLRVKPSVASRAVAALETEGYVARVPDPADARACRIHLTDAGRAHLRQRQQRALRLVSRTFDDFSPEDAERSIKLLKRLETSVVEWVSHVEDAESRGVDPLEAGEVKLDTAMKLGTSSEHGTAPTHDTSPERNTSPEHNTGSEGSASAESAATAGSATGSRTALKPRAATHSSPTPTTRTAWEKTTA